MSAASVIGLSLVGLFCNTLGIFLTRICPWYGWKSEAVVWINVAAIALGIFNIARALA